MDDLIKYLEKILHVTPDDLMLSEEERVGLYAKIELLDLIKDIRDKGYPND